MAVDGTTNTLCRDLATIRKSLERRWPIPEQRKQDIIERLFDLLNSSSESVALGAVKTFQAFDAQSQLDELTLLKLAAAARKQPALNLHSWGPSGIPPATESDDGNQAIDAEFVVNPAAGTNAAGFIEQATPEELLATKEVFDQLDLYRGLGPEQDETPNLRR